MNPSFPSLSHHEIPISSPKPYNIAVDSFFMLDISNDLFPFVHTTVRFSVIKPAEVVAKHFIS